MKHETAKPSIVYQYGNSLFINLTNRCASTCTFCIKYKWKGRFRGSSLRLKREPSSAQVIKAIGNPLDYDEVVFCGYGEPLLRLSVLLKVARWLHSKGAKVRINTSGMANLYHGKNILPQLSGLVDSISVSLNACDAASYLKLHRPAFGLKSYDGVKDFIKEALKVVPKVTATFINFPGSDMKKNRRLAKSLGAAFRLRPYLDDYEI